MTTTKLHRPIDLHPDDHTNRADLIAAFTAARRGAGLGIRRLAPTLGVAPSAISNLEIDARRNPKLATIARYARAVGHRVVLTVHDLPAPDPGDPLVRLLAGMADHGDPVRADQLHRSRTLAHLVSARHELGVTQQQLAARIGCADNAIAQIEADRPDPLLSTYQRYTRALGGHLTAHLHPTT